MGYLFVLVYLAIVLAVIEINVVLFTATGLERTVARFQVISMLTGTGFTTGESELIIDHPIRRKLGAFLILFGAFSLAVIISAISNLLSDSFFTLEIAYIAGFLIVSIFILKTPLVKKRLSNLFEKELEEHYELADLPIADVLLTSKEDEIVEIAIDEDSGFAGKCFKDIISSDSDIMVLFIIRGDLKIRTEGYTKELQPGDKALLYGNGKAIRKKFEKNIVQHQHTSNPGRS
ncbi:TrkA C-terminal domain-containing protein [Mesobacillus foraminis]|uniref:TrkA family protein n=1 Tax=Mesobacillus foraminis TaxID=279826 RepID=A0A4R2B843_9BACI|nr:TrkA C-terminal domain-containing protein [Mesobacillus foraminis]TCN22242.1 TrkA family protein [Mesobacillus foraminis]